MRRTHARPFPFHTAGYAAHRQNNERPQDNGPVLQNRFKDDPYEIAPDGGKFGISFRGEIKVHGLEFERAKEIVDILNGVDHESKT